MPKGDTTNDASATTTVGSAGVYATLASKFAKPHRRQGSDFDYLTGFQVIDHLNTTLGYDGWTFVVAEHGINELANEIWVLGRLICWSPTGREIIREQFGSQKINKSRSTGAVLDIGFDLKGAATDALKKCASLIGVGLWLSSKGDESMAIREPETEHTQQANTGTRQEAPPSTAIPKCETCQRPLCQVNLPDKSTRSADQFAEMGRQAFGKVLCVEHYSAAAKAAKSGDGSKDTTEGPKATENGAQAQETAPGANPPTGPIRAAGKVNRTIVVARYGEAVGRLVGTGYKEPTQQLKAGLYSSLQKNLGWKREDVHKLLGLNPATQHLEDYLQLAECKTGDIYHLCELRHKNEDTRVPTYADLVA